MCESVDEFGIKIQGFFMLQYCPLTGTKDTLFYYGYPLLIWFYYSFHLILRKDTNGEITVIGMTEGPQQKIWVYKKS